MRPGWLGFASILLALLLFSALAQAQSAGEVLFKGKCALCHGQDGSGKTLMGDKLKIRDLRSDDVQKQSAAELNQIVTKGKGKMAPYEGKVPAEQIEQLVVYIRQLGKKK